MSSALRVAMAGLRVGHLELDSDTSRYVVKVHRLREGDALRLFDPEAALEAKATIQRSQLPHIVVVVEQVSEAERHGLPVTLLQAVGKGDKPEQVIRDATVLGAAAVVLVETDRTVARSRGEDRIKRHQRVAVEAARQCGRSDLPALHGPLPYEEALERTTSPHKLVFAWHPEARPLLVELAGWDPREELTLLIGPEGGLSAAEVESAVRAGFRPVSLGPLVLRTETAATVSLGVLRARAELGAPQR